MADYFSNCGKLTLICGTNTKAAQLSRVSSTQSLIYVFVMLLYTLALVGWLV